MSLPPSASELDVETLRRAHAELLANVAAITQERQQVEQELQYVKRENEALRAERAALLRRLFGPRSEKIAHTQGGLFKEAERELEQEKRELAKAAASSPLEPAEEPTRNKAKRKRLPNDLPRERREFALEEADRHCARCDAVMERFGEDVTEEIEYVPATVKVVEYVRAKYGCRCCGQGVVTAPGPDRPIEKGKPGPALLAHVAVSKFADHIPLYRLSQIFERQGLEISRMTMCGWIGAAADLLSPVVEAMKHELLREPLLQSDDTVVPYQDRSVPGKTARGFLWAYTKPWAEVVYDFTTDRSRAGPLGFLAGYEGYLQADAFAGYNELFRGGQVHHIGCMAHVRRKIYESRAEVPEAAETLIAGIQRLYRIERHGKQEGLTGEGLVALRHEQAAPIFDVLAEYLSEVVGTTLPRSGFGTAVRYAIDQWPSIRRYVDVAEAELDNNSCEHTIRAVALGRKNWLFAGSEAGGHRAATIYSLVSSCKRLGMDPQAYLSDVLARVATHKLSRIDELTPRAWKLARSA